MITPLHIRSTVPKCPPEWAKALADTMPFYGINTPIRAAMFIAQCAHESAGFTVFVENLNYSADALMRVWPSRFPDRATADRYARKPEAIANCVYARRMGNGSEASGDGWKYRGRGCIQLTGRQNYEAASKVIGHDYLDNPDDVLVPTHGAAVACWFWSSRRLNELADKGDFRAITKAINGGYHGMQDRERWLAVARGVMTTDPMDLNGNQRRLV